MTTEDYQKNIAESYLDNEQRIILESNSNTIIKAGPGSGKTRVLTLKAAKLLLENIKIPRGLACITYTNKAANELKYRLNKYGIKKQKNLFVNTIHQFCMNNILYPFANLYNKDSLIKYKIAPKSNKLISQILNQISYEDQNAYKILFKEYKYKKYDDQQAIVDEWYKKYLETFYSNNLTNFDLIIDESFDLLENDYICKCIEAKFPYILIDEYQDSSIAMHSLFQKLMKKTNIIFYIVGDPNQSIYSFSASSPEYFNELYASETFEKIELKKNYRTKNDLFSIAKRFLFKIEDIPSVNLNTNCYFKKCDSLQEQIKYISSDILPKLLSKGLLPKDICILYRDYLAENIIVDVLTQENIDFTDNNKIYVKKDFSDSDLVIFIEHAVLWCLGKNKQDEDLSYKNLFFEYLRILYRGKILSEDTQKILKINLYKILTSFKYADETLLKDFLDYLNDNLNIVELLKMNNPDEIDAYNDIYEKTISYSINYFANAIESENSIRILSAHSSKGLEYKAVIIPDLEDGRYPDWRTQNEDIDEEKRLLFVATTRAKEYLFILASGFYINNKGTRFEQGISRFFNDIKQYFADCDDFK